MNTDIVAARARLDAMENLLDLAFDAVTLSHNDRGFLRSMLRGQREEWQNMVNVVGNWHKERESRAMRELRASAAEAVSLAITDAHLTMGISFEMERHIDARDRKES